MIKTRFAPSPTGFLHIGGARTCLFSWLYARSKNSRFILRIEDTDKQRSKQEYLDEILESLNWLGFDWDEIGYQSERFDVYRACAEKLISEGKAYHKDGAVFIKCKPEPIRIKDLIRGEIVFPQLPKEEEVIIKSDGSPTYNFSCVVDDALMEITHVIRGEDHISNTPRQIIMYETLGFKVPEFAHVPLILSESGGRMSKRCGATSIRDYRQQGYLPEAIVNYLLLLGWSPGDDKEIISLKEAINVFDINNVNKTAAAFSLDKLKWINGEYIRALPLEEFCDLAKEYLEKNNCLPPGANPEYFKKAIGMFQVRISVLEELVQQSKFCFFEDYSYNEQSQNVLKEDESDKIKILISRFSQIKEFTKESLEKEFRVLAAELGIKMKVLVHPVRVALTGSKNGPGLFEMMEVLGKDRVISRLDRLIKYWEDENA